VNPRRGSAASLREDSSVMQKFREAIKQILLRMNAKDANQLFVFIRETAAVSFAERRQKNRFS
jgi:hypothetical protein